MKWYIGIQSQIVTLLLGLAALYYVNENDISLPATSQLIALSFVFIIAFVGGFMAPYHVGRTAKYGSVTFAIIAGIPLIIILYVTGEINNDSSSDPGEQLGAVIVFIVLIAIAIALGISIVVVAIVLFVGGFIGSIFGKMFFRFEQYEPLYPKVR